MLSIQPASSSSSSETPDIRQPTVSWSSSCTGFPFTRSCGRFDVGVSLKNDSVLWPPFNSCCACVHCFQIFLTSCPGRAFVKIIVFPFTSHWYYNRFSIPITFPLPYTSRLSTLEPSGSTGIHVVRLLQTSPSAADSPNVYTFHLSPAELWHLRPAPTDVLRHR
jgi:hypothetical protein